MAGDKPKNIVSISDLDDIEANPDPVKIPLKSGKFVTFPDVWDMPLEDAEAFFAQFYRAQETNQFSSVLKMWLSEDDYEAFMGQFGTLRKLGPVIERVMNAYEKSWGTPGEGDDSES